MRLALPRSESVNFGDIARNRRREAETFRPDIEGLRGVAVLAVVLFHAEVPGFGGGFVGVDVFFVISGFLITGLLWREASTAGAVRLLRFYGARARRLLPASAAVGIITMLASTILLPPLQVPGVLRDGIASALYVGNYWLIHRGTDYFGGHLPPSPFQHYWSLAVEEQFYLLWPALIIGTMWLVRRFRRRATADPSAATRPYVAILAILIGVSLVMSLVGTYVSPAEAFFSTQTRAWQLGLGGLVALSTDFWCRLSPRAAAISGWAGLVLISVACTSLSAATQYPGIAALVPTLGAVLVIGAGISTPTNGCGYALAAAPMQAIGRFSYSWYLWHWPVLLLTPALLGHSLSLPARLTAALLSAALAIVTLRFIENPLRFSNRLRNSSARSLALGAAATAAVVCAGLVLPVAVPTAVGRGARVAPLEFTAGSIPPGSDSAAYDLAIKNVVAEVQAAVVASVTVSAVPSNLEPSLDDTAAEQAGMALSGCLLGVSEGGPHPECATGDRDSPTRVALVGDSFAAMWYPAFDYIAAQRHWRLELLAKGRCPMMNLQSTNGLQRALVEEPLKCQPWRAEIMARLRAERPQLVVVSMFRGYTPSSNGSYTSFASYDATWLTALARLVEELRGLGAKVLVLGPVPDPGAVVPICLSGHLDDASACSLAISSAVNRAGIDAEAAVTKAAGGQYADLTELFCASERCPVIVGNTLVYSDWGHLTSRYARQLAPVIGLLAQRAVAHG